MQYSKNLPITFLTLLCTTLLCFLTLAACNSDSDNDTSSNATTGTLETSLTDASTDQFKSVYVTIKDVKVHKADGQWESVMSGENKNSTYDLLELVNGVKEKLGVAELQTGKYTQMRLMIGTVKQGDHDFANYVVDSNGQPHELFIPSGSKSGLKLVHPFTITNTSTTHLILDFDASESIVVTGNQRSQNPNQNYILKPTIKVIEEKTSAVVKGQLDGSDQESNMGGTRMSLQTYNAAAADPKDRVKVLTHTMAQQNNTNATYQLQIKGGTYNLVGYKQGYKPESINKLTLEEENTYNKNMTLQATTSTGTVNGTLNGTTIVNQEYQYIELSLRRELGDQMIEAKGLKKGTETKDGEISESFETNLPYGEYTIVASTNGSDTIEKKVSLNASSPNATNLGFDFKLQ